MKAKFVNEKFDWSGRWIPEESPFERAGEYTQKQELVRELLEVTKKYEGRIKDITIYDALNNVMKKYNK